MSDASEVVELPAYDPEALATFTGDTGLDGVIEFLQLFHASAQAALLAMAAAVTVGNCRIVQWHAHTLKSSAAQVGAMAFSHLAATLETRLQVGGGCSDAEVVAMYEALAKFAAAARLAHVDLFQVPRSAA
jgi:HPt (histidine-containing phosphotransfer) domain-containing protein